jgi:uncharacterized protein
MGTVSNRLLAVVTGGSSGIGFELARQFLDHGYDVLVAADRDVQEARMRLGTDGTNVLGVEVDLSTKEGCDRLCDEIDSLARPVDAIALNAGFGVHGEFTETELEAEVKMIELNCTAVVRLAKHVVPAMRARGRGHVLITSSVAAIIPATFMSVYGGTKAFDLQFAEALREELRDTGVNVTAVQPGATDTQFFERADMLDTKVGVSDKDSPALVAKQAFDAMIAGKDKIYAGSIRSRVQGLASEILPETAKAKQHRKLAEPGSGSKS